MKHWCVLDLVRPRDFNLWLSPMRSRILSPCAFNNVRSRACVISMYQCLVYNVHQRVVKF
jgi:hypothetical protein